MKNYRNLLFLGLATLILQWLLFAANTPIAAAAPKAFATPILLVTDAASSNKFGAYLGEILRAEGMNYFDTKDLASVLSSDLTTHDVTILAQTATLNASQVTLFSDYVNGGGRLLAMRPDSQIASLFGLTGSASPLSNGYLKIDPLATVNGAKPGLGLPTATLQIHTAIDQYTLVVTATIIAQLYSDASTATAFPAVVSDGTGHAIAFLYDLATNVAYTRQGNPAQANLDSDCDGVVRTVDLFQAPVGTCPMTPTVPYPAPWVDRTKIPLPQADEQQRLFARAIQSLLNGLLPMPQVWYFPGTAKTMLILTADAHGNPTSYFQNEVTSVNTHHGKISFFIAQATDPNSTDMLAWIGQSDSFGIHPYGPAGNPPQPNLTTGFNAADTWWSTNHFTVTRSNATRNHQLAWEGWTNGAAVAAAHSIAMDTSFYHYGQWLSDGVTWAHGYLTGSGQPMKFVQSDGTILPIYQQATQLVDEQTIIDIAPCIECLTSAQGLGVSQQLIDSSLAGDYAALTAMFHVDYYNFGNVQPWAEGTMDYAFNHAVPIWNADDWLGFTQARHDTNLTNFIWGANALTFTANPAQSVTIMVPTNINGHYIQAVTQDGSSIPHTGQMIKGVNVAFFNAAAGAHTYLVQYNTATAVQVSNFSARAEATDTWQLPTLGLTALLVTGSLSFVVRRKRRR